MLIKAKHYFTIKQFSGYSHTKANSLTGISFKLISNVSVIIMNLKVHNICTGITQHGCPFSGIFFTYAHNLVSTRSNISSFENFHHLSYLRHWFLSTTFTQNSEAIIMTIYLLNIYH